MTEKRQNSRVLVRDLHADISVIGPDSLLVTTLTGGVVDMSYSGIKIKLLTAMPNIASQSKITIILTGASLSTPMTIKGMVRHISAANECGIAFTNELGMPEIDSFVFECIRKIPNHVW